MALRREITRELRKRGYVGKDGVMAFRINEEFSRVVDVGPLNRRTDVHPVVGLCCHPLENLMTSLRELPASPHPITLGGNAGDILEGAYRYFEPPVSTSEVVEYIERAFARLDPYASLPAVPGALRELSVTSANPSTLYRLVLAYYLLGDAAGMEEALVAARKAYVRDPADEMAESFRSFELRLRGRLTSSG